MFRAVLMTQWRWTRNAFVMVAVAVIAMPLWSVGLIEGSGVTEMEIRQVLSRMEFTGFLYGMMAFITGMIAAGGAWNSDSTSNYVYAMTLPLPRWHFVMLRFGAGALILLSAALAVWVGALVATTIAALPPTLHAYPSAIALRFLLASLVAYSLGFAILVKGRGPVMWLLGALGAATAIALMAAAENVEMARPLGDLLVGSRGVFGIFTGSWMLIDV